MRVQLLGPPRVEREGHAVEMDTRKATALLAYLSLGGKAQARDRLAAMFWPKAGTERARGALRRTLSTLRAGLGVGGLRTEGQSVAIGDDVEVDVARFRQLLGADRLEDAVAAYGGDFLAGFTLSDSPEFDDWQAEQTDALRGELTAALERLASRSSEPSAALAYARRWVHADPLAEPAHRAVMRLLFRAGDRAAALRQFRECATLLDRELGVRPMAETTALRDAIERGDELEERSTPRVLDESVGDLYRLHGDYTKAAASYETAIAALPVHARAPVEHKLADVHHRRGRWDDAERLYEAAVRDTEDPALRARATADWSLAVHRRGITDRAVRLATRALALAQGAHDDRALAQAHNILGILTGDRSHHERALRLAERIGDPEMRVAALNNLAVACARAGEFRRAITLTEDALAAARLIGDRHRVAALHNNLADLLRAAGRTEDAMRQLKRAVTLFAEIGDEGTAEPEVWKLAQW